MDEENKISNDSSTNPENTESVETTTSTSEATKEGTTPTNTTASDTSSQNASTTDTHTQPIASSPIEETPKKKGKKLPIIIGVIVALIVVAAAVIFFVIKPGQGGGVSIGSKAETNTYISAKYDADGIAYVPLMNGNVAKVDDDVFRTAITPDRKHIIILTNDKLLYYTGADQAEKTQITDNGNSIAAIGDEGILYSDYDGDYHRYLFSDGSDVNIGDVDDYKQSDANFNIAFSIDSSVYMLAGNSQEKEKLGNVTNDCEFLYVSDDGKTVYWDDNKDYEETIFVFDNGEKSKVGTFETSSKYTSTYVTYNESKKFAVVTNYNSDMLFIVTTTGEPLKIKLGNELASSTVYTISGLLEKDSSSEYKGIYVSIEGSDGNNLYFIDAKGEREKVLSKIGTYAIYENYLYYVDEDNNLKIAKLNAATLSDEEKVTGDVEIVNSTIINGYLFFAKDYNSKDETGILYAYKKGSEPVKVTSDVTCWMYGSWGYISGGISTDGKTLYFYKDSSDINDTYSEYAVLYKFTYGDSEPTKIASDVVEGTLSSGYVSGLINNNSFTYFKYSSVKDKNIIGDWYYYNGTDSSKMAGDVIK